MNSYMDVRKAHNGMTSTIHSLFEEQVLRTPESIALRFGDDEISYRNLNEEVNCLANHLREMSISHGHVVGVLLNRSMKMIVSILAILKSGAAYLPIDPQYPLERIQYMLEDSQARLLITETLFAGLKLDIECMFIDEKPFVHTIMENPADINQPDDLAYIIYTSGSTGKPKGVLIEHRAVVNFFRE